jgi:hypothetical protein
LWWGGAGVEGGGNMGMSGNGNMGAANWSLNSMGRQSVSFSWSARKKRLFLFFSKKIAAPWNLPP